MVSSVRHISDCLPERLVEPAEHLSSPPFGQPQPAALVVEVVAGGAALQQSFGSLIEVVDHGFDLGPEVGENRGVRVQALVELAFEVADALFHGAVVRPGAGRAVEREHTVALQNLVDGFMVEGAAVVPFQAKP